MKKRILNVALAVVMCLSLAVPAFASATGDEGIMPLSEYITCPNCGDYGCVVRYVTRTDKNGNKVVYRVESHSACGYHYECVWG